MSRARANGPRGIDDRDRVGRIYMYTVLISSCVPTLNGIFNARKDKLRRRAFACRKRGCRRVCIVVEKILFYVRRKRADCRLIMVLYNVAVRMLSL